MGREGKEAVQAVWEMCTETLAPEDRQGRPREYEEGPPPMPAEGGREGEGTGTGSSMEATGAEMGGGEGEGEALAVKSESRETALDDYLLLCRSIVMRHWEHGLFSRQTVNRLIHALDACHTSQEVIDCSLFIKDRNERLWTALLAVGAPLTNFTRRVPPSRLLPFPISTPSKSWQVYPRNLTVGQDVMRVVAFVALVFHLFLLIADFGYFMNVQFTLLIHLYLAITYTFIVFTTSDPSSPPLPPPSSTLHEREQWRSGWTVQ